MEGSEECDTGNTDNADGDGCTQFCRLGGCPGDIDLDGDLADDDLAAMRGATGCFPCAVATCNPVCDMNGDGLVNNLDVLQLQLNLGATCASFAPVYAAAAPPQAPRRWCGLGGELVLVLPPLLGWRRARRARRA